ncbi:MAG: hypothetical protein IKA36_06270 [Clostridia bacterium]|nr:hypothetical protein [Clostridia bacterium]
MDKITPLGPTKLLPDHNWIHKTIEELEKEGRINSEGHWTPNIDFNGDPKFACHFKTELSRVTKIKLMNAINDMLEKRSQDLLKPPCSIVVTEGDDKNHVKVHIIFDSFNGIETKKEDDDINERRTHSGKE